MLAVPTLVRRLYSLSISFYFDTAVSIREANTQTRNAITDKEEHELNCKEREERRRKRVSATPTDSR